MALQDFLHNPQEAANAFSSVPKQRNLFLVRFYPYGAQAGANRDTLQALSFIAKAVDRPKINPKTEELHQYNKKRQVYTGFKLESVRMQFYDDAQNSAALAMWQDYVRYYFGDFNANVAQSYRYDVTTNEFADDEHTGFGFTGKSLTGDGDFYFDRIEIYHFYNRLYDGYQLIHPKITAFDPDDLDYENSNVSIIALTVAYEDLQFIVQKDYQSGDFHGEAFPEFAQGATFDGRVIKMPEQSTQPNDASGTDPTSSSTPVDSLLNTAQGLLSGDVADYRYNGTTSGGSLGMFGNFQFAPNGQQNLTAIALTNTALAVGLGLGSEVDPLTVRQHSVLGTVNTAARRGLNGAAYDVARGRASAVTSGYGGATNTITNALVTSAAVNNDASIITRRGVRLTPQGYGAINVRQSGTAQYGYNANTDADGTSWGYSGQEGFDGPIGPENDGPFTSDVPSGIDGRYGVPDKSLG